MANAPTDAPAPPARKKGSLPLIVAAAVVLLGAGGAVALVAGGGGEDGAADHAAAAETPAEEPGVVALEPMILNLADPEGDRYVRMSVRIGLCSEAAALKLAGDALQIARVHDRVLTSVSSKTADEITSFEGKETLRTELIHVIAPLFEEALVADVYFTEFLVQ